MPSYKKNKLWQVYVQHVLITASGHRSPFNYKIMLNFRTMLPVFHNYYGCMNPTGFWQQSITPGFEALSIIL